VYSLEERYLHDPVTGARLQHAIHHPPPVAGVLATLAAHSKKWQTKTDLNVSGKVALGVSVLGRAKPADVTPQPKQIAAPIDAEVRELPEAPATPIQPNTEAPMPEDRVKSSPFYIPPDPRVRKQPEGAVKVFAPESAPGDPPEIAGGTADAARADVPVPAPRSDVEQHVSVRAAKRRIHEGQPARNAVERQMMNALTFNLTPEQREKRLRELTGSYRDADDKQEGLGAGPSGPAGVRAV
jgi:hypothetical protein